MTRVSTHPRPEQRSLLAACTVSSSQPARTVRRAHADEVLAELRAEDVRILDYAAARALLRTPMHDPSEGSHPIAALLARAEHVRAERDAACRAMFDEDRRRREDIAAAEWIDDTLGRYMAEKASAIADLAPATLTAGAALTNALADLDELLDMPLPGTDFAADLRAVLPVRVAQQKGSVA